jgi:multiple sugar transport system permease protein
MTSPNRSALSSRAARQGATALAGYGLMAVALIVVLAPFAWLVISAISSKADLITLPLQWLPEDPSFDRLLDLLLGTGPSARDFRAAMWNSLVISSATTIIAMTTGVLAAYAFARLRFPGRNRLILVFMAMYMLPAVAIVLPVFSFMSAVGWLDTQLALIVVYPSFVTPFVIWLMRGFFETLPEDIEDAARIDGCSRLGALWRVVLPISIPGLVSTALLAFLLVWDEYFYALILTQTNAAKTLPVAISDFIGRYTIDFPLLASGGLIAALPPVLIAFVFQRYIVAGLTAGGVQGS